MKVLILGSGAREHAIAAAVARSPLNPEILVAPGNDGVLDMAQSVAIDLKDIDGLIDLARLEKVDLTIAGSEEPLVAGAWDRFDAAGLKLFGPSAAAAQLEGSKTFAKNFMTRYGIPTARFESFDEVDAALKALKNFKLPLVLKADGLAAGKGVHIVEDYLQAETLLRRIMCDEQHGAAGKRVIIEECLSGPEISVFAIVDGYSYRVLGCAQDHKRAYDDDKGPNTGGMGAYSPVPLVDESLMAEIENRFLAPTLVGMLEEGSPYRGFLYLGLMLTPSGPKLLEYNVRLGDPEAQVLLPRIESDFLSLVLAAESGDVKSAPLEVSPNTAIGVVVAAAGYPEAPRQGDIVAGVEQARQAGVQVYCAGIRVRDSQYVTSGGRLLTLVGLDGEIQQAQQRVYAALKKIDIAGSFYRRDIGHSALEAQDWRNPESVS